MEEGMHIVENRVASFAEAKFTWPHPDTFGVTPLNLAVAGFYFDPQYEDDDSCICFLCQKYLGGWEEEDNPISEHISHAPYCAWAKLLCSQLYVTSETIPLEDFVEDEYLPTSSFMEAARAATFQQFWPHENKKGWLCNVKKMAKAGFHYNPTPDSDDTVCCIYCNTALDGWEPRDSPVKEHRKRAPTCPFFTKDLKATLKKQTIARDKEVIVDAVVEADEVEAEDPLASDLDKSEPRASSSSEKPQTQSKTKNQRASRKKKEEKVNVEVAQNVEPSPAVPERKVRGGRKRKLDVQTQEAVGKINHEKDNSMAENTRQANNNQHDDNDAEQESKPKSKKTRKQGNRVVDISEDAEQETTTPLLESNDLPSSQTSAVHLTADEEPDSMYQRLADHEEHGDIRSPISKANLPENVPPNASEKLVSSTSQNPDLHLDMAHVEEVDNHKECLLSGVLSEEEQNMSVEQFMRSLIDKQVKKLQSESERKIAQFMQEADNIKKMIIAMDS